MTHNDEKSNRYMVDAVDKACTLLNLISNNPNLSLADLSRISGINKSRCMRLLLTLGKHNIVSKENDQSWALGIGAVILGQKATHQYSVIDVINKHLKNLRDDINETAQFRILSGLKSICIAKADSTRSIRIHSAIGMPMDLYFGSSKVLLAFADRHIVDKVTSTKMEKFTDNTITDAVLLRKELQKIRKQGYAISRGERTSGVLALGVPIHDMNQKLVGAISISGPEERLHVNIDRTIEKLFQIQDQLSNKFDFDF